MADITKIRKNGTIYYLNDYDDYNRDQIDAFLAKKYEKPSTGIPKSDLASEVSESLNKADTAYANLGGIKFSITDAGLLHIEEA